MSRDDIEGRLALRLRVDPDFVSVQVDREDLRALLLDYQERGRALEAASPAPEGEVAAWRYRYPNDPTWQLTQDRDQAFTNTGEVQPLYASPVVPVGREDVEVVAEWLEIAKETPKPLHSSLNYVPVCASEIEAIERILAVLGTKATDTGREG